MTEIDGLRERVAKDPGSPDFVVLADRLRMEGKLDEALKICLAGLSATPSMSHGRLVLARVFYEGGFTPFAVRELEHLCNEHPANQSLRKLLEKISPTHGAVSAPGHVSAPAATSPAVHTHAEAEFDFDDIELIEEKP